MHKQDNRSFIDTMKSLSPAPRTLRPLGIRSHWCTQWHNFNRLCSLIVCVECGMAGLLEKMLLNFLDQNSSRNQPKFRQRNQVLPPCRPVSNLFCRDRSLRQRSHGNFFCQIFYRGGDPSLSFIDSGNPVATTCCLSSVFSGLLLLHQTGAGCVVVIWPRTFSHQFVKEREFGFGGLADNVGICVCRLHPPNDRHLCLSPTCGQCRAGRSATFC